jgi:K+-sensing histidine kinase KdpD
MALALAQRRAELAAQPDLARIEREAEKLDELVGHVMTLSRLRTATAPRRDVVRLDSLVAEVVEDARFERPEAKLEYTASGEVQIRGDPDGLKSAVENVVRNALVYGDPAQPIEVRLEAGADTAVVRVSIAGPGSARRVAKIFEPFFRADKSRDHSARRPGDRVMITARVMELHAQCRVCNREGGGLEVISSPASGDPSHRKTATCSHAAQSGAARGIARASPGLHFAFRQAGVEAVTALPEPRVSSRQSPRVFLIDGAR